MPSLFDLARLAYEAPEAVRSALRELEQGRGPIAAAKAFAAETSHRGDDALPEYLVSLARTGVRYADTVIGYTATGLDYLPRVAEGARQVADTVEAVAAVAGEAAYQLGKYRTTLRVWLEA